MTGITIPAEVHQTMIQTFRQEYELEFGNMKSCVQYTRDQLVEKYSNDIIFWHKRTPVIDLDQVPDMNVICAHAICTNAIRQMYNLTDGRNITNDVKFVVGKWEQLNR